MSNSEARVVYENMLLAEIKRRKQHIVDFQGEINRFQNSINISQKYIDDCEKKLRKAKVNKLKDLSDE